MQHPHPYAAMTAYAACARDGWSWLRLIGVVFGFEVIFYLTPAIAAMIFPATPFWVDWGTPEPPGTTLLQFASFGIAAFGLAMLVKGLHGREPATLLGPGEAARRDTWRAALYCLAALLTIDILPPFGDLEGAALARPFGMWLILLAPGLLAVLIQVTTEELFYRGYLQQQLAAKFRDRWIWMGVPSLVFGLNHYWNGFGPADGVLYALWTTALGLACADLTARTGNLGAAIGLHFANNIVAVLVYGVEGFPGSGLALFHWPYDDPFQYDWSLATLWTIDSAWQLTLWMGSLAIIWLAARLAVRR